jgi:hypothetical protein
LVLEFLTKNLGFEKVYNLQGGILNWIENKFDFQLFFNDHSPWVHSITPTTYLVTDVSMYFIPLQYKQIFNQKKKKITKKSLLIDSSNGSIKDEAKTALKKFIDLHKLTVELVVHTNAVGSKDTQTKKKIIL